MKRFLSSYLGKGLAALLIIFTACEDGEEVFDQIVNAEQRGAILRTVNLISNELPIGQSDAAFSVELEEQDQQNGELLASVEVFIGFNDNTADVGPGTNVPEAPYTTIERSAFSTGEFGLPRTTFSVTLPEMLSFVGRADSDITGGDQFTIRFELVLTDGRRFSNDDNSGTITGSYFSSPFFYTPTVICPIPEGAFTGSYSLVQDTGGIFGAVIEDGTYELVATSGTSRDIAINAYPQFGGFARNLLFDLVCGDVKIIEQDMALACGGGPNIVWREASIVTTYDPNDDSSFTIQIFEAGGGCGADADNVTFTLTKN